MIGNTPTMLFDCPSCGKNASVTGTQYKKNGTRRRRYCGSDSCLMFVTFTKDNDIEIFDCWLLDENRNSPEYREKRGIYGDM